jgi:AcrR family transcriptional regulator
MNDIAPTEPAPLPPGLRERKKQQTRGRIVQVARALFAEKGYDATTVAAIASGADISVPTLFTYFPTKEEIYFSDYAVAQAEVEGWLAARPGGQTALESLLEWGARRRPAMVDSDPGWQATFSRILDAHPALQGSEWVRLMRTRHALAAEIGRDLDLPPENLLPQLLAATAVVAITTVASVGRRHQQDTPDADPYEQIAYAQELLRASNDALKKLPPPSY